ncbi:SDR family NAD(P)-dependent oxidoreductase [Rhodobaculum claviforme]|uniref:3-hydroxyacyl-CoA dehydrogenase n=1 Tax=Rhodobaculum claviforme TaxID=1549854 RepID=A0A934WK91_9RHOB|nr:SDR family NAD(P)-dependent oxidoreductase [Rhodobaculum claviforme]MBK5928861.1 3-hydroxyacyl-CoA dehydrogenase [Rhodobaculum claviforme]
MQTKDIAALVTGGGSGLGEATARALAADGARVAILDRNMDAARAVAQDIGALAIDCDVTSADAAEAALARAAEAHGPARILVNCAGVGPAQKILGRKGLMPLDDFRKVVEINLVGSFNMLRLFVAGAADLAPLASGERGVVVNTASVAAYDGQIGQTAYAASKGGVVGLTLPAARELASMAIRVVTIAPGLFGTPMLRALPQDAQDSLSASVPFPARLGEPSEYADLVRYILSAEMLNGEVIRLDGALRMAPR